MPGDYADAKVENYQKFYLFRFIQINFFCVVRRLDLNCYLMDIA